MKLLLKILNYFFIALGVIFFIIILFGIYLFVADPFGIKPFLSIFGKSISIPKDMSTSTSTQSTTDKNPSLTPEQEKTLESMGINPATLPTKITPELQTCLIQKLGEARTAELLKSGKPTPMDFLKAGSCLK